MTTTTKLGAAAIALIGLLMPTARAEILMFGDQTSFEAALDGQFHELIGIEDFEDAAITFPDAESIDDPLDVSTDNDVFSPGDIFKGLRIQANTLGDDAPSESPRGERALFVRDRTGGTTSKAATHNFGSDSYDVIPQTEVTAIRFKFHVTTKISIPDGRIQVWSSDGDLLAEDFYSTSGPGRFVGIVATEGETLDRINLYNNFQFSAYVGVDDIVMYSGPRGFPLGLSELMPGVPGQLNELTVKGATPGATVFFAFGRGSGATAVPGCSANVDIDNAGVIGSAVADAAGDVTLEVSVPASATGWFLLQAVETGSCALSDLTLVEL